MPHLEPLFMRISHFTPLHYSSQKTFYFILIQSSFRLHFGVWSSLSSLSFSVRGICQKSYVHLSKDWYKKCHFLLHKEAFPPKLTSTSLFTPHTFEGGRLSDPHWWWVCSGWIWRDWSTWVYSGFLRSYNQLEIWWRSWLFLYFHLRSRSKSL